MTTALELISDALAEIGALGVGQSLNANDAALGLRLLNRLMQRWANTRLAIPVASEISVPLTGAANYSIGPSGDVVAARPVRLVSAIATDGSGTDYVVSVYPRDMWDEIAVKDVTGGPPAAIWYEAVNTDGVVHVFPKSSGYTLKVRGQTVLQVFADLSEALLLPDGYEAAIVYSLARDLCGAFERPVSADLARKQAGAVAAIKRTNTEPLLLKVGLAEQPFMIERGY